MFLSVVLLKLNMASRLALMKLTRSQLIHATDKQLNAIQVTRQDNAGWLKKALLTDFSPVQVQAFNQIGLLRRQKNRKPREQPKQVLQKPEKAYDNSAEAEVNAIYESNRSEFE